MLDKENKQLALERTKAAPVSEADCNLSPEQRFNYYDHPHVTGTDLPMPPVGCAAITINKDMTVRDFAQAAYRMRKIGRGQTLFVLIPSEIIRQIDPRTSEKVSRRLAGMAVQKPVKIDDGEEDEEEDDETSGPPRELGFLHKIIMWMLSAAHKQEQTQRRALTNQLIGNVWRKPGSVGAHAIDEEYLPALGHPASTAQRTRKLLETRFEKDCTSTASEGEWLKALSDDKKETLTGGELDNRQRKRLSNPMEMCYHVLRIIDEKLSAGKVRLKPGMDTDDAKVAIMKYCWFSSWPIFGNSRYVKTFLGIELDDGTFFKQVVDGSYRMALLSAETAERFGQHTDTHTKERAVTTEAQLVIEALTEEMAIGLPNAQVRDRPGGDDGG